MIGLMLTALLMTACTSNTPNQNQPDDPRGGDAVSAEEIVRIETRTVGNGSYCDFPMYALDLPDGELWVEALCDDTGKQTAESGDAPFEQIATLTDEQITEVHETFGAEESSILLDELENAAAASREVQCEDGASTTLRIVYTDGTERTIVSGNCGVEASGKVTAPLTLLKELSQEATDHDQ